MPDMGFPVRKICKDLLASRDSNRETDEADRSFSDKRKKTGKQNVVCSPVRYRAMEADASALGRLCFI